MIHIGNDVRLLDNVKIEENKPDFEGGTAKDPLTRFTRMWK